MQHCELTAQITAHYSHLLSQLRRKVRDHELAADLLQDAIAISLQKARRGALAAQPSVAGYVFRVGMNLWRNQRRKMCNRAGSHVGIEALMSVGDLPDSLQDECSQRLLVSALASMAERDCTIITRLYLAEDDRRAICADLQLSPSQLNMALVRARQRLRAKLEFFRQALGPTAC